MAEEWIPTWNDAVFTSPLAVTFLFTIDLSASLFEILDSAEIISIDPLLS
jgi:hypothetical protein